MNEQKVLKELGEDGVRRLVSAFYAKVRNDDLIASMYPEGDWSGAETRLADFLVFRFGGDDKYIRERGHPRLRMRHGPFSIGIAERDRWLKLMNDAMDETKVPDSIRLWLKTFFEQVAEFMRNT